MAKTKQDRNQPKPTIPGGLHIINEDKREERGNFRLVINKEKPSGKPTTPKPNK